MKGLIRNLFVICMGLIFVALPTSVYGANFETERYDVSLDVKENNSFYVEEVISVNFTSPSHGIYRYIPYHGTVTYQLPNGDMVKKDYKVKLKEVETPGFKNEISYENNKMLIRIGDPDMVLSGSATYTLRYQVMGYEDRDAHLDQLYWGLLQGEWETSIKNAEFNITMPKDFDYSKVEFIAGAYGENDTSLVEWSGEGNTIKGSIRRELQKGEGMTLRIVLPEGYFVGESNNDWMAAVMCVFIALASMISILLWWFFGKDKKVVKTVEFYPPEGVSPGEIGYILDGVVDNNDVVSMILHFANEGYLEIREEEEDQFRLIKIKDLPESSETYEYTLFQGLFSERDSVDMEELKGDFYASFQASKSQLKGKFTKDRGNLIFTTASIFAQILSALILINPLLCVAVLGVAYCYLPMGYSFMFLPAVAFVLFGYVTMRSLYERKDSARKQFKVGMSIATIFLIGVGLGLFLIEGIFLLKLPLVSIFAALSSVICIICTVVMKRRTKYSIQILGKLLGFKEFIRTAELDRIKVLAEENPKYFYHVLPYAYIFGLTDIWAKKFESIAVPAPDWYQSGYNGAMFNTYVFLHSFHHYTNAMNNSIVMPSSGSIGSIGGGFTSGGGFSGGGMSSGGGGSW